MEDYVLFELFLLAVIKLWLYLHNSPIVKKSTSVLEFNFSKRCFFLEWKGISQPHNSINTHYVGRSPIQLLTVHDVA